MEKLADKYSLKRDDSTLYSDFMTNLNPHPDSKQVVVLKNEDAVVRSIKNILFTNKYEVPFEPTKGAKINSYLFENFSYQTSKGLEEEIRSVIENNEPRAKLLGVIVDEIEEKNILVVTIIFYTTNIEKPTTFKFILERVR